MQAKKSRNSAIPLLAFALEACHAVSAQLDSHILAMQFATDLTLALFPRIH
jgi:hypothetical protein